jgi:hypothetical protein
MAGKEQQMRCVSYNSFFHVRWEGHSNPKRNRQTILECWMFLNLLVPTLFDLFEPAHKKSTKKWSTRDPPNPHDPVEKRRGEKVIRYRLLSDDSLHSDLVAK